MFGERKIGLVFWRERRKENCQLGIGEKNISPSYENVNDKIQFSNRRFEIFDFNFSKMFKCFLTFEYFSSFLFFFLISFFRVSFTKFHSQNKSLKLLTKILSISRGSNIVIKRRTEELIFDVSETLERDFSNSSITSSSRFELRNTHGKCLKSDIWARCNIR